MRRLLISATAALLVMPAFGGIAMAQGGTIDVSLDCYSNPERLVVTNNTTTAITVESVRRLDDPRQGELYRTGHQLTPEQSVTYESGTNATTNTLTRQHIFDNDAADEGALVVSSAGEIRVLCVRRTGALGVRPPETDVTFPTQPPGVPTRPISQPTPIAPPSPADSPAAPIQPVAEPTTAPPPVATDTQLVAGAPAAPAQAPGKASVAPAQVSGKTGAVPAQAPAQAPTAKPAAVAPAQSPSVGPVAQAQGPVAQAAAAPAQVPATRPAALPRTGSLPIEALALFGSLMSGAGVAVRRFIW